MAFKASRMSDEERSYVYDTSYLIDRNIRQRILFILFRRSSLVFFLTLLLFFYSMPKTIRAMTIGKDVSGYGTGYLSGRISDSNSLYPKRFYFYGTAELQYNISSTQTRYGARTSKSDETSFQQMYTLAVQGYIFHPKFAIFTASVSFGKENEDSNVTRMSQQFKSQKLTYEFSGEFFRRKPFRLSVFAVREDMNDKGNFQLSNVDSVANYYGINLTLLYKKLPLMQFEYNHSDFSTDSLFEQQVVTKKKMIMAKNQIDTFSAIIKDRLPFLKTAYRLRVDYEIYSWNTGLETNYNIFRVTADSQSVIFKQNILSNSFSYEAGSGNDSYSRLTFSSYLDLRPIKDRFFHSYYMQFTSSEAVYGNSNDYSLSSSWRYRISRFFQLRSNMFYQLGSVDGQSKTTEKAKFGVFYDKYFGKYNFLSSYNVLFSSDNKQNSSAKAMTHDITLSLDANIFKWAKAYAYYNFMYSDFDTSFSPDFYPGREPQQNTSLQNDFRVGVRGRGPQRALWTIEGEYVGANSTGNIDQAWLSVWNNTQTPGTNLRSYFLRGNIGFRVFGAGIITFAAERMTGTSDSQNIESYTYESGLQYSFRRNLNLSANWRYDYRTQTYPTLTHSDTRQEVKTTDYELRLVYIWRKVQVSMQYFMTAEDTINTATKTQRLLLRVQRWFQ